MINGIFQSMRRSALLTVFLALLPLNFVQAAWPEKPIKIVLPFGAGGVADVTARILADRLGQKLNQRLATKICCVR